MKIDLFSCMPDNVKRKLLHRDYLAGSPIILSDYDNCYVFFLIRGYAEAYIQNSNGSRAFVYSYKPNDIFGEIEPFYTGDLKPVSVAAITDCYVEYLRKDDFLEWLKSDFNAVSVLIGTISDKLVKNGILIAEMSLMSVNERVLRCVANYYDKNMLHLLTKKQIALEVNTPIRSVNRAIMQCCSQGIFCYKNKHFVVINEDALSAHLSKYL